MPRRLNRLMQNANATLYSVQDLIAFAKAFLADLTDGIRIEFVRLPGGSMWDFFRGNIDRLPICVKVVFEETDEEQPASNDSAAEDGE